MFTLNISILENWTQLISYIAACNRTFTALSGRIVSPGWPGKYPQNILCLMNVTVPAGYTLQFFFRVLDIEEHGNCAFDYMQVREGTYTLECK